MSFARNHIAGIGLAVILALNVVIVNALAKYLGDWLHPAAIMFWRNAIALVLVALVLTATERGRKRFKSARPFLQILHAVITTISMGATFAAYHLLPMAEATGLLYTAPLFLTLFAPFMLKERVDAPLIVTVLVGFAGALIMIAPEGAMTLRGAALGLFGALTFALALVCLRKLGDSEHPQTTTLYFLLFSTLITGGAMLFVDSTMPAYIVPAAIGIGIAGACSQALRSYAFALAPASLLAPINYTGFVWACLIGILIWGDWPDGVTLLGAAAIIGANLWLAFREQTIKQK